MQIKIYTGVKKKDIVEEIMKGISLTYSYWDGKITITPHCISDGKYYAGMSTTIDLTPIVLDILRKRL